MLLHRLIVITVDDAHSICLRADRDLSSTLLYFADYYSSGVQV